MAKIKGTVKVFSSGDDKKSRKTKDRTGSKSDHTK